MNETIDDLTVNYEEDGLLATKETGKVVLTKGAWSTIIYKFQTWDAKKQIYSPDKYTIRRYQKRNNQYMQKSKFNISSKDQAEKIIEVLSGWVGEQG